MDDSVHALQEQMFTQVVWPMVRLGIGAAIVLGIFELAWHGLLIPLVRSLVDLLFPLGRSQAARRTARVRPRR